MIGQLVRATVLGAGFSLGACAPRDPPLLAIDASGCDATPQFAAAVPVPFDRSGGASARLGGASGRCLAVPGGAGPTTYAVFALPEAVPYTLTIASHGTAGVLIVPRATFYDIELKPGRVIDPQDFQTVIDGLRAGIRLKGGERYVVVEADRSRLGQPAMLRLGDRGGVRVAATTYIYLPAATLPDVVRERAAIYALNGTIQVSAQPIPVSAYRD